MDSFDWKNYPDLTLQKNRHGKYEISLKLDDAALSGTQDQQTEMSEIISRYQIRKNIQNLNQDSYSQLKCDHVIDPDTDAIKALTDEMVLEALTEAIQNDASLTSAE